MQVEQVGIRMHWQLLGGICTTTNMVYDHTFFSPHLKSVAYNYQKPHFYGVGFSNAYKATFAKCGHRTKRPRFRAAAYLEQDEYTYTINRPHLLIVPNIFYLGYTLKMGL